MQRRSFLKVAALSSAAALTSPGCSTVNQAEPGTHPTAAQAPFELEETTLAELQKGLAQGRYSSAKLVRLYLDRINQIDRQCYALNSVIELNPDAVAIANALDKERKAKGPRSPLHGIPVLIKDNIDTHDRMTTTAGSLALQGSIAPKDSGVARQLKEAGLIILGKTNLSEWANFRGTHSTSGWSGRGGGKPVIHTHWIEILPARVPVRRWPWLQTSVRWRSARKPMVPFSHRPRSMGLLGSNRPSA